MSFVNYSKFVILLLVVFLNGCSSATTQKDNLFLAHYHFSKENYRKCFTRATDAELLGFHSKEVSSQIMFYKALCLEMLGQKSASNGVLENLLDNYPETDWGMAAKNKLSEQSSNCQK